MHRKRAQLRLRHLVVFCLLVGTSLARADDAEDLHSLLDYFLANADAVAAHERIWADDLVYTSSGGTRTDKAAILAGMRNTGADADAAARVTEYSAEDVDIRVYGNAAVVAFRLVAESGADGAERTDFLNTGTFLKRNGTWQAVAWQATRIPADTGASGD